MASYKIFGFGIAKDIFGSSAIELQMDANATIAQLKKQLEEKYPKLQKLASYLVAVNETYASNDTILNAEDEIAIIPPVSGG
ncbi:MAG: MoaD/ThiS family protein [Flavipsychrobacter sp.]